MINQNRRSFEEIYRSRERREKKLKYFAEIKIKLTLGTVFKDTKLFTDVLTEVS